jgi:hypothetical protein
MKHESHLGRSHDVQTEETIDKVLAIGSGIAIMRPRQTDVLVDDGSCYGRTGGRELRQGSSGRARRVEEKLRLCGREASGRGASPAVGRGRHRRNHEGRRRREAKPYRLSGHLLFEIRIHIIEKIVHIKCNASFIHKTMVYICKIINVHYY